MTHQSIITTGAVHDQQQSPNKTTKMIILENKNSERGYRYTKPNQKKKRKTTFICNKGLGWESNSQSMHFVANLSPALTPVKHLEIVGAAYLTNLQKRVEF